MDINTPRGRESLAQALRAREILLSHWPACEIMMTPQDMPAAVDAVVALIGEWPVIAALAEIKARKNTLADLRGQFKNEWLVTADKIAENQQAAKLLGVESWGILYLVPDDIVLRIKLWHPKKGWLVKYRTERTETQATVNGGRANRVNAFIPMETADLMTEKRKADDAQP